MLTTKTAALALILLAIITLPAVLTFANAQTSRTVEEQLVSVAQKAGDQVQNTITQIYAEPNATQKIQNAQLTSQLEGNITQYQTEGLTLLSEAQEALTNSQYASASDSALQALAVFRNVYGSLQSIMNNAGVSSGASVDKQELIDAIDSEIQRVDTLIEILPANAAQDTLSALNQTNQTLQNAKTLAFKGEISNAQAEFLKAKQDTTQIYQTLKTKAQQSNSWRLSEYCQNLLQQIQQRFAYGKQNGIDFTDALASKGYQSEAQFIAALQTRIQTAQDQGNLQKAITECQSISQMVQQIEQALNQEISNQQQGQSNAGGSGTSGDGAGNINNGGSGSSGTGNGNATKAGKS